MRWLGASILSCTCFCAVALGTLLPLRDAAGIQYIFVWPGASTLLAAFAVTALTLICIYRTVAKRAQRLVPEHAASARSGEWLAPLTLLTLCPFGVLAAAPGVGVVASVLGYFLYDLRWWWLATILLWIGIRADPLSGTPIGRRLRRVESLTPPARLLFFDTVLLVGVMTCALASTRYLRFDPGLHGDEPKYIRYGEVWYQGRGFEVSDNKAFRDMPLDASSRLLDNAVLLSTAIGEESRALIQDLKGFIASPSGFQWNRAERHEGFVTGKRGGLYQIYMPGVSFFLFPGYFLDRHVLSLRSTEQGEFPAELVMTNLTMLFLYGLCAVALFRLLRHALASDVLALFWSALAMLSLPSAAFAFQFYPEIPALFIILLVTTYIWFHAPGAPWTRAAAAGLGAGTLAWFHPRFLLVSLVLMAVGAMRTTDNRARFGFVTAALLGHLSVMAFAYRVTGSWMPTALWDAPGAESTLNPQAVPLTLFGYALHRIWGLVPHAPILFLTIPGLVVLARRAPARAAFILAVGLALAAPAAAHTLSAAGGTPGRLIVAIVPLFYWPIAVLVRRFWSSPSVRVPTVVGLIISLETAFAYNWHHIKIMGPMRSAGVSGWRPNLGFPLVSGGGWSDSAANVALFYLMVALGVAATIVAFVAAKRERQEPRPLSTWIAGSTALLLILLSGGATAFNRRWVDGQYLIREDEANRAAAETLVERDDCRICFATRARAIDWRWLEPNATERVHVETSVRSRAATVRVTLDGEEGALRFGRIRIEFGDGSATDWTGIVNATELDHTYSQSGDYSVVVWLQLRNGEMRADRRTLTIPDSP
jgi:hypothetical protein